MCVETWLISWSTVLLEDLRSHHDLLVFFIDVSVVGPRRLCVSVPDFLGGGVVFSQKQFRLRLICDFVGCELKTWHNVSVHYSTK